MILNYKNIYSQEWGDFRYTSNNGFQKAIEYRNQLKERVECYIQSLLNKDTIPDSFPWKTTCKPDMDIKEIANSCGYYNYLEFLLPYRDTLMVLLRKESGINFCDYNTTTFIAFLDKKRIYKDSINYSVRSNLRVAAKMKGGYNLTCYETTLRELINVKIANARVSGLENNKLTYENLFRLAEEVIFINNDDLNKLFWKAFECKREIPIVFCNWFDRKMDTANVSLAFIFGVAYANYFYDPLFYNLETNPYSVAEINCVPFDKKAYDEFIPLMERYINYITCENIKIPFLIKFDKTPRNGKSDYKYFPTPAKYSNIPDSCSGKTSKDFPLNFCPIDYYKDEK